MFVSRGSFYEQIYYFPQKRLTENLLDLILISVSSHQISVTAHTCHVVLSKKLAPLFRYCSQLPLLSSCPKWSSRSLSEGGTWFNDCAREERYISL